MPGLRICIDARLEPGLSGGVEQFVIGLAGGLCALADGDEEYFFLTFPGKHDWLRPYVGPKNILTAKTLSVPRRALNLALAKAPYWGRHLDRLPQSDGTIEAANIDLMHFTFQAAFVTDVPNIYHPHDLQHVHLPQFFSRRERAVREHQYGAFCRRARMVAVASNWVKNDVIQHYGLSAEKVQVVPLAPATASYEAPSAEDLARTRAELQLPEAFAFYPAQTWPHKNHLGLIEAIAMLRDAHGLSVPLVCSGRRNEYYAVIERRMRELRVESLVRFVDFVSPSTLQCLYALARMVIIPTFFEAGSFPLAEAFRAGTPAACSNVTSLPEQAGDAALIFDPSSQIEMRDAIRRLWTDAELRATLVARGRPRIASRSWEQTARLFRAHYRRLAGREISADEREAIAKPEVLA